MITDKPCHLLKVDLSSSKLIPQNDAKCQPRSYHHDFSKISTLSMTSTRLLWLCHCEKHQIALHGTDLNCIQDQLHVCSLHSTVILYHVCRGYCAPGLFCTDGMRPFPNVWNGALVFTRRAQTKWPHKEDVNLWHTCRLDQITRLTQILYDAVSIDQ